MEFFGLKNQTRGHVAHERIEDLVTYDNEGNKVYPETGSSEENPNNVDSDNDGIYDDEELSEEEEKALADAPKVITGNDENEDELSERDVAVLCGASEDYEENKEQCDKLYNMLEKGEIKDDPDFEYD